MTLPIKDRLPPDDLNAIEAKMQQLVAEDHAISRSVLTRDAAVKFLGSGQSL